MADANVGRALYQRACGYSHKAVKIFADMKTGAEKIVPYIEHYPPDTVACIFWLKNRRPDLWRDMSRVEHGGPNSKPIQIETLDRGAALEELKRRNALPEALLARLARRDAPANGNGNGNGNGHRHD